MLGCWCSRNGSFVPWLRFAIRPDLEKYTSDLQVCRAAYRNRSDDLRITRRIRVVHGRPGGHICSARLACQSARVRGGPGPLLANSLARLILVAASTALHPGRAEPGRPPRAARPARVRPMMPVVSGCCLQHAFPNLWTRVRRGSRGSVTSAACPARVCRMSPDVAE